MTSLTRRLRSLVRRNKKQPPRYRKTRRLMTEGLEKRELLATDVRLVDGVLNIQDDDSASVVEVVPSATNPNRIAVTTFDGSAAHTFARADVREIQYRGSGGDDTFINGSDLPSVVNGGAGNDVLVGGSDRDVLIGGDGDDDLHGGAGPDRLLGGPGDDGLDGGTGRDHLFGEEGGDWFFVDPLETLTDLQTEDASINFINGDTDWTDNERLQVQDAFRQIHAATDNTILMKDPVSGKPLKLMRVAFLGQNVLGTHTSATPEVVFNGDGKFFEQVHFVRRPASAATISIPDGLFFSNNPLAVPNPARTIWHELAHNWDNVDALRPIFPARAEGFIDDFLREGGWQSQQTGGLQASWDPNDGNFFDPGGVWPTQRFTITAAEDPARAGQTAPYAQFNPYEDFAVSFSDYVEYRQFEAIDPNAAPTIRGRYVAIDAIVDAIAQTQWKPIQPIELAASAILDEITGNLPDPVSRTLLDSLTPTGLEALEGLLDNAGLAQLASQLSQGANTFLLKQLGGERLMAFVSGLSVKQVANLFQGLDTGEAGRLLSSLSGAAADTLLSSVSIQEVTSVLNAMDSKVALSTLRSLAVPSLTKLAPHLSRSLNVLAVEELSADQAKGVLRALAPTESIQVIARLSLERATDAFEGLTVRVANYVAERLNSETLAAIVNSLSPGKAAQLASNVLGTKSVRRMFGQFGNERVTDVLEAMPVESLGRVANQLSLEQQVHAVNTLGGKHGKTFFQSLSAKRTLQVVHRLGTPMAQHVVKNWITVKDADYVFKHLHAKKLKDIVTGFSDGKSAHFAAHILGGESIRRMFDQLSDGRARDVLKAMRTEHLGRVANHLPLRKQVYAVKKLGAADAKKFFHSLSSKNTLYVMGRLDASLGRHAFRHWMSVRDADYVLERLHWKKLRPIISRFSVSQASWWARRVDGKAVTRMFGHLSHKKAGQVMDRLRGGRMLAATKAFGAQELAKVMKYSRNETMNEIFRVIDAKKSGQVVNSFSKGMKKHVKKYVNAEYMKKGASHWNQDAKRIIGRRVRSVRFW